jgi:hypothetical protein
MVDYLFTGVRAGTERLVVLAEIARIGSRLALTATGIQPRAIGCATRTFRFCCQTGIACSPAGRDTVETPRRSFR